ncbi:MAG: M28 family peptidase [Acidobacteria bacterium]|nr:M28 family peptidase [Acidobacteriota bacterium]
MRRLTLSLVLVCLTVAAGAAAQVQPATITGPIAVTVPPGDPSRDFIFSTSAIDLAGYGYVEEEFFIEGTANRYTTPELATGRIVDGGHPYKTRLVVRRPASPDRFNGTVVVEWNNVTAGRDLDIDWFQAGAYFVRNGFVWIGVSAQRVGVDHLRQWSPARYGSLDVTHDGMIEDDALSYDIFSAVGRAVRDPGDVDVLGGLDAARLFATGHSQSASRLAVYLNSVHPRDPVFDAVVVHGGGRRIRQDQDVKIWKLMAEGDMVSRADIRQPDTDTFRTWEVAGSSHVDIFFRIESSRVAALEAGRELATAETGIPDCERPAYSRVPFRHVLHAAFDHLVRWVEDATPPPTAPPIDTASVGPPAVFARDARGNALGGIRLAAHAVPTATNTGTNTGNQRFCRLYGTHEPFDAATLARLYPSPEVYVDAVKAVVAANLAAGYILEHDATATVREAERSDIGTPYGAIDGDHLKVYVEELTAVSRRYRDAGHQFWGRIIGTAADAENAAWMADKLRAAGVPEVRTQRFDLAPQWMPRSWSVTAAAGARAIVLRTAQPAYTTPGTPAGGLDLELVYVGLGTEADFAGRDVAGKAALITSMPMRSTLRHSATVNGAVRRADALGAAAILVSVALPGNLRTQFYPTRTEAPTFSLGQQDGDALRAMVESDGPAPRVHVDLDVEMVEGLQTANVWATLPGMTDEKIVIVAHRDGWFEGANDNAAGVATTVVLAEYFASLPRERRRRTLQFIGTPGHHNSARVGVEWIEDNAGTVLDKTVLLINAEHTGAVDLYMLGNRFEWSNRPAALMWGVSGSPALRHIATDAYETFGVSTLLDAGGPVGEIRGLEDIVPSIWLIDAPEYFHSDHETAATVPAEGIEAVTRAFAKIIDEVNALDVEELQRP